MTQKSGNGLVKVTGLEAALLRKIVHCDFMDGNDPVDHAVWLNVIAESKSDGGVVTSLQSKGLVGVEVYPKHHRDDCIWITAAGMAALKVVETHVPPVADLGFGHNDDGTGRTELSGLLDVLSGGKGKRS